MDAIVCHANILFEGEIYTTFQMNTSNNYFVLFRRQTDPQVTKNKMAKTTKIYLNKFSLFILFYPAYRLIQVNIQFPGYICHIFAICFGSVTACH